MNHSVIMNSWTFDKHTKTEIPHVEQLTMAARTGLEARYASRFVKYVGTSDETLKNNDNARKVVDNFRTSAGVIETQSENINELFTVAEMFVKTIDDFQKQSGKRLVQNIPLPGDSIKQSFGKKLGFVKLSMMFMNAGLLHFMEETLSLQEELKGRDNLIKAIAAETREVALLGKLQDITLDELSTLDPIIDTANRYDSDNISVTESDASTKRDSGVSMTSTPKKESSSPTLPKGMFQKKDAKKVQK